LIEASRLQSNPDVIGSGFELDTTIRTGQAPAKVPRPGPTKSLNIDELPEPYSTVFEGIYHARLDLAQQAGIASRGRSALAAARDRMRSTTLHMSPAGPTIDIDLIADKVGGGPLPWWHTWVERGHVFWTLISPLGQADGGFIDLREDSDLAAALNACALGNGMPAPVPSGRDDDDLSGALKAFESFEELQITAPLAKLLPPALAEQAHSATRRSPCGCMPRSPPNCPQCHGQSFQSDRTRTRHVWSNAVASPTCHRSPPSRHRRAIRIRQPFGRSC